MGLISGFALLASAFLFDLPKSIDTQYHNKYDPYSREVADVIDQIRFTRFDDLGRGFCGYLSVNHFKTYKEAVISMAKEQCQRAEIPWSQWTADFLL